MTPSEMPSLALTYTRWEVDGEGGVMGKAVCQEKESWDGEGGV